MSGKSIVARVYDVLDEDIYMRNSIRLGIANLSAVSEKIRAESIPEASAEAVRAAVRRYVAEMEHESEDDGLHKLLANTEFSLKSNISVIQVFQDRQISQRLEEVFKKVGKEFNLISSSHAVTIITGDENAQAIIKLLGKENVAANRRGLHAIYLISGKEIKTTPGFVAFITALFLRKGINVIEFYSCFTDTVLIVSREDSLKAYELLDKVLGKKKHHLHG